MGFIVRLILGYVLIVFWNADANGVLGFPSQQVLSADPQNVTALPILQLAKSEDGQNTRENSTSETPRTVQDEKLNRADHRKASISKPLEKVSVIANENDTTKGEEVIATTNQAEALDTSKPKTDEGEIQKVNRQQNANITTNQTISSINENNNSKLVELTSSNSTPFVHNFIGSTNSVRSNERTNITAEENLVDTSAHRPKVQKDSLDRNENSRSLDIKKYISPEFHDKNKVYNIPLSPETRRYLSFETEQFHKDFTPENDGSPDFTTPATNFFDDIHKDSKDEYMQSLGEFDHDHYNESDQEHGESKIPEQMLNAFLDKTANVSKTELEISKFQNLQTNNTKNKTGIYSSKFSEERTSINYHMTFNDTEIVDEDEPEDKDGNDSKEESEFSQIESTNVIKGVESSEREDSVDEENSKENESEGANITNTSTSFDLPPKPAVINKNESRASILTNSIVESKSKQSRKDLLSTYPTVSEEEITKERVSPFIVNNTTKPILISKRAKLNVTNDIRMVPPIQSRTRLEKPININETDNAIDVLKLRGQTNQTKTENNVEMEKKKVEVVSTLKSSTTLRPPTGISVNSIPTTAKTKLSYKINKTQENLTVINNPMAPEMIKDVVTNSNHSIIVKSTTDEIPTTTADLTNDTNVNFLSTTEIFTTTLEDITATSTFYNEEPTTTYTPFDEDNITNQGTTESEKLLLETIASITLSTITETTTGSIEEFASSLLPTEESSTNASNELGEAVTLSLENSGVIEESTNGGVENGIPTTTFSNVEEESRNISQPSIQQHEASYENTSSTSAPIPESNTDRFYISGFIINTTSKAVTNTSSEFPIDTTSDIISESAINTASEPAINTSEPAINTSEPAINTSEPAINTSEATINTSEPAINKSEPAINTLEPAINTSKSAMNTISKPVINTTSGSVLNTTEIPISSTSHWNDNGSSLADSGFKEINDTSAINKVEETNDDKGIFDEDDFDYSSTTAFNDLFDIEKELVANGTVSSVQEKVNEERAAKISTSLPPFTSSSTIEILHIASVGHDQTSITPEVFRPGHSYPGPETENRDVTIDSVTDSDDTTQATTVALEVGASNRDGGEGNGATIAAIVISCIGAVCLLLLAGLLFLIKRRHKRSNYGQRCTPVSLDAYSVDSISVYNSVRRKGILRASKRSYGNPAFEDSMCASNPLNFNTLTKFAENRESMVAEFDDIPVITAQMNELPEGCDTKNRYANVIPLPETRVNLLPIDGYLNSDYINANYVTGPKSVKGYYVACQAPLQNTVDDFWRMVWEQQSKLILMITQLYENHVEKCVDYLPPSEVLDCHRLFGDFEVTLKKREVKEKYVISSLQLKNMVSNSWREVTHMWYLGWPEKGVPMEVNSIIAFLIEARSFVKLSTPESDKINYPNGPNGTGISPVVVHCSPGTGRTGTVIACDMAIREFELSRQVDIPKLVYRIRRDRAGAVQTKDQYTFIYKVASTYAIKLTGGVTLDNL